MASGRKSFLDGILYFINILFALGLLSSYLAYYIPPGILSFFSFAALAYPVLAIGNIIFIVYWAIRLKRKILLSVICLAVGYLHLGRLYQFGSPKRVTEKGNSLKVMSFNVRMFNLYQWLDDENIREDILEVIREEQPDVILLQEYYEDKKNPLASLNYPYRHARLGNMGKAYGLMILSRFPITGSQVIEIENDTAANNQFHFADIRWKDRNIRFVNSHLASVGLGDADYKLLENPENENQENLKNGLISITKRLNRTFQRHEIQAKTLKKIITESPYPVVLAGDFNDVPQSYMYHQVNLELKDSFMESGIGFGKTYVKSPVPLRIDYIFHSDSLLSFNYHTIKEELSDHYPVVTELQWK